MKILELIAVASVAFFTVSNVNAIDKERYIKIADSTVQQVQQGGSIHIEKLLAEQNQLIQIGINGSLLYIATNHDQAAVLGEVIASAEKMKTMTLDEIEKQWHQGEYMKSRGYDMKKLDHFGSLYGLMDSIIHPATCYINLKNYQRTKDKAFLDRCVGELIEVIEHVKHIETIGVEK